MSKSVNRPWYAVAKQLGKEKGITQQQVADACGVTKGAVSQWYSGGNRPRLETIQRIAQVLGTTLTELVSEDPYFLTEDKEREIIDLYRQIPKEKQEEAAKLLAAFFSLSQQN
jgi:transcriptional regulator with XRE-family HTH domain